MNETQNNQQAPQTEKKPLDSKFLIIGAGVLVLVVVLVLVFVFVKPGNGGTDGPGGTVNPSEQKITLTGKDLGNGRILVTAKNTKPATYDIEFTLSFYDENNQFMRSFSDRIPAIQSGKVAYFTVDTAGLVKGKYTFNFEITSEKEMPAAKVFTDKFTSKSTKNEDHILVQFENKSGVEVDAVKVGVLYYNANEPVEFTSQYVLNVGAGYTLNETVYIPTDANGNKIKFDRHEVILTAYDNE